MKQEKVKKPFYKKWWVWVLAVIVFLGAIGGEEEVADTTADSTTQSVEAEPEIAEEETVEETPESVEEEPVEVDVEEEPAEPEMSLAQENAIRKANDYLKFTAFSKTGLADQLEFEGFSTEEATFAVDNIVVDWKEQAAAKAQDYLDISAYSRTGLIDQLEFEGFTTEEATYGVDQVGL